MPDGWEVSNSLNPLEDDADEDYDNDGLTNLQEYELGTDPRDSDSDDDSYPDGVEIEYGSNPLNPSSTPNSKRIITISILISVAVIASIGLTWYLVRLFRRIRNEMKISEEREMALFGYVSRKEQRYIESLGFNSKTEYNTLKSLGFNTKIEYLHDVISTQISEIIENSNRLVMMEERLQNTNIIRDELLAMKSDLSLIRGRSSSQIESINEYLVLSRSHVDESWLSAINRLKEMKVRISRIANNLETLLRRN